LAGQSIWAVYSVYARQVSRRFPPTLLTPGAYIASAAFPLPPSLFERPRQGLPPLTPRPGLPIPYPATLVALAHISFYWGIRVVAAAVASLTVNLIPFQVLAVSWLLLGEPVTWAHVVGALVVIAGVALATRRGQSAPEPTEER